MKKEVEEERREAALDEHCVAFLRCDRVLLARCAHVDPILIDYRRCKVCSNHVFCHFSSKHLFDSGTQSLRWSTAQQRALLAIREC